MGQPVTVIEKPSSYLGVVRFETNRPLTGTGHEIYRSEADVEVATDTPSSRVARALFAHGGVSAVSVNANVISVHLATTDATEGLKEVVEEMFIHYREGVEVVQPEGFGD